MFKVTKQHILNLLDLLDKHGLIHGAGDTKYEFCIQQAVNRVIHDDLYGQYSDSPGWDCLNQEIRSFGVGMNDCSSNLTSENRAKALKRFAIAELGSVYISSKDFYMKMNVRLGIDGNTNEIIHDYMYSKDQELTQFQRLKKLADTAADVLKDLGTEGSQFLYLVDESDKKKQRKEACKLGKQIYAAQMADFSRKSCEVQPKQQH